MTDDAWTHCHVSIHCHVISYQLSQDDTTRVSLSETGIIAKNRQSQLPRSPPTPTEQAIIGTSNSILLPRNIPLS